MFRRVKLSIVVAISVTVGHGPTLAGTLDVGVLSQRTDVDGDRDIDLSDFGIMKSEFGKVTIPGGFETPSDLNLDQVVDITDFGILKENFGKRQPPIRLGGDVNGDNRIDLDDIALFKGYFGLRGSGIPADFNQDGTVNLTDLGIMKESFGSHTPASGVPEPSTWLLAALAGAGLLAFRRGAARSLRPL
jgi:hypothetical protein